MRIGIVIAIETDAVFSYYKDVEKLSCPTGFELFRVKREGQEIYMIHTGMGEIAAAAGVQYLITACGAEMIVNFGVVGGLSAEMALRKLCIVQRVVHYKYDCSEFMDLAVGQLPEHDSIFLRPDAALTEKALVCCPELMPVTCCSGDKFVGTAEEKLSLHERFEGDVCDMESAGIVLTCEMNGVPCLLLKAVSDGLANAAGSFYEELQGAAYECLKVTDEVIGKL